MGWDSNLAAADAAVAGYFDTQVFTAHAMTKPLRDVNALPQADPTRPAFEFMGSIELDPDMTALGTPQFPTPSSPGDRRVAKICLTALSVGWPWMLRQGDQLETGGARYALSAAPDRDGTDRIVLWLNKVAA